MDGIIVVHKEKGLTSHDVVYKLRKILNTKKIGHTGTLDPDVSGVLPVCIGKATKLVEILTDKDKEYICEMVLGIDTDTEDISGKILNEQLQSKLPTTNEVKDVLNSFLGITKQQVPMYSSVRYKGKKLYEYARAGKVIDDRPIRDINIKYIDLISDIKLDNNKIYFTFKVCVSKGTYIRTLCKDIALKLNTIGCMNHLIRTKSGFFNLEESYKLSDIENKDYNLLSILDVLSKYDFSIRNISEFDENKILNGNKICAKSNKITKPTIICKNDNKVITLYDICNDNNEIAKQIKYIGE